MCAQFHGLIDSIIQFKLNLVNRLLRSCRLQMIIMQANNWKKRIDTSIPTKNFISHIMRLRWFGPPKLKLRKIFEVGMYFYFGKKPCPYILCLEILAKDILKLSQISSISKHSECEDRPRQFFRDVYLCRTQFDRILLSVIINI